MRIEIVMPKLSDSMTEGGVVTWLKAEGDKVAKGDAIAEIETDKSTVDLEAPDAGVFAGIAVAAGTQHIAVGTVLAWIETEGSGTVAATPAAGAARPAAPSPSPAAPSIAASPPANAAPVAAAAPTTAAPTAASPGAQPEGEAGVTLPTASPQPVPPAVAATAVQSPESPPKPAPAAQTTPAPNGAAARATPLAARMAAQAGIDLSTLRATGIGGKICKADVETALGRSPATESARNGSAAKAPASSAAPASAPNRATAASARIRRVVAERMSLSKQTIPHFYLSVDCCVDRLLEARARLNTDASGYKLSLNDFVLRATAAALKRVPEANASWVDGAVRSHDSIDIAVAVAMDEGLVTPVVRSADTKGLADISREVAALAEKARAGKLLPADYDGATFTVSNLGMYGVGSLYAIINPPQACILGVGAAEQKPVVRDGAVVVGTVMTLTISADHRILDGATGARLLADIRRSLEEPTRMLL